MDDFREWLSDNLRYIALILGILVVVLGIFFGVRAVVKRTDSPQTVDLATNSVPDTSQVTSAAAKPTPTKVPEKEEGELVTKDGNLSDYAVRSIAGVINTYYTALNTRSTDTVRALTDALSEEDITAIETSETAYSDMTVISKNGLTRDGKTAVAFVEYKYQNPDQAISHPGLSWLYLNYNETEKAYKISVKASEDTAIQSYVQSLSEEADIAAVIERVQTEAAAADAAETGVPADSSGNSSVTESGENTPATPAETENADPQSEDEAAQAEAEAAAQAEAEAQAAAEAEAAAQAEAEAEAAAQAEAEAEAAAEAAAVQEGLGEGEYVILETCNVRKNPANDAEVVTVVEQGDVVTVLEEDKGWYHVLTESGEGYIGKRFVNMQ